ncbi:MAG: CRISPR-associated protein Cas4 [Clostridiaceae bacterium]|nr:CRISPR-associated protein Cas4 [Clostridiaceae bacterium]
MEYPEDKWLLLSGIQHFVYCRRQWALIHVENEWVDNSLTTLGKLIHESVHESARRFERRGNLLIARGLHVCSRRLGITGVCDVVEFIKDDIGIELYGVKGKYKPIPVEYKRGVPKKSDEDIVQVTAQAMCLEEMLGCEILNATLYYGSTKRRLVIAIDEQRRNRVRELCAEMHHLMDRRFTPHVKVGEKCKSCSLRDICLPDMDRFNSAKRYVQQSVTEI